MVAPIALTAITPIPVGISTFNTRQVPPLEVGGSGYPCGSDENVNPGGLVCAPDGRQSRNPNCVLANGNFIPNICNPSSQTFNRQCCNCQIVRPVAGFCATFSTDCVDRRFWQSSGPVSPITGVPTTFYFPPANTGQVLTYTAPGCTGDIGAPLIHLRANSIFGVMVATTATCTSTVGTQTGLGLSDYAQFVDRGQQDGVWVGALASRLIGQAPFGTGKGG